MANVIIKSEERERRQDKILADFGHGSNASRETMEHAEHLAEKCHEAQLELRRRGNGR